ncbi:hypothetical protein TNCV_1991831 [Trichonephila clavipes]|nr:hypothetical protein TNCV_1991831 [Trichonephila clavipes]
MQWTEENQTTLTSWKRPRKGMSTSDDRHQVHIALMDLIASFREFATHRLTAKVYPCLLRQSINVWLAYYLDTSPIFHVGEFAGRHLHCDTRPTARTNVNNKECSSTGISERIGALRDVMTARRCVFTTRLHAACTSVDTTALGRVL